MFIQKIGNSYCTVLERIDLKDLKVKCEVCEENEATIGRMCDGCFTLSSKPVEEN